MTTAADQFGLPQDLGNGLLLRWATTEDTEALGDFNLEMHRSAPAPEYDFLRQWTQDLMSGRHPTTKASDFLVVVDRKRGSQIVSTLNLISQTWAYEGIPFGVGRVELVATQPDYRRRGLVRRQMDVIHALSASRSELVTGITGIPWYYRQFDYEMALDLSGSRQYYWIRPGNDEPVEEETYTWREAQTTDIQLLQELYEIQCRHSIVVRQRDAGIWHYELFVAQRQTGADANVRLIEDSDRRVVGYVEFQQWGTAFVVREVSVVPGHSWRAVGLFLTRTLKKEADRLNVEREKPINNISYELGEGHPMYQALGRQLERQNRPYAWYVRVPDLRGFLLHIRSALEQRLACSVLAGHTGRLRINTYRERHELVWEKGELVDIIDYAADRLEEGDVQFPDLTFLQLLFGRRSFAELDAAFADCFVTNAEAWVLIQILFPQRPSFVIPLG